MDKINIGEHLLRCRKAANLTQADVAKELGIRQTAVSNWEGNVSRPSLEMLIKLTGLYSVSLNSLCGVPEKKESYKISRMINDLSAASYCGILQIEKDKGGAILFKLPMDYFLYADENWEDDESHPEYVTHGTTEFFDTLKDLLGIRRKGLNADSVIGTWVSDTVRKTKEDGDNRGFKSSSDVYAHLMGYDEEG